MESLVHLSLAFAILLSFVVAHPGHNLHRGPDHFPEARQDGGAPFAGIEGLSTSSGIGLTTATRTTVTQTSRLTTQYSGARPSGPTTYISAGTRSLGPIPVTIIPVPIATICSLDVRQPFAALEIPPIWSPTPLHPNSQPKLPAVATALLGLNATRASATAVPVPTFTAYDGSGCSTLYTRKYLAVCSTVLSGLGALPISVTDCEQSVTFSTSTREVPAPTAAIPSDTRAEGQPTGRRLAYFIAPWYDIADGQLPSSVVVLDCVQGVRDKACSKATESWMAMKQTTSVDLTRSLDFEGSVTGPAVLILEKGIFTTSVPASVTTMLSIHTNVSTTIVTVVPSLSRSVVRASMTAPPTTVSSTVAAGGLTTSTVVVEAVSHTTVTVFRTLTRTVMLGMTTEGSAAASGKVVR